MEVNFEDAFYNELRSLIQHSNYNKMATKTAKKNNKKTVEILKEKAVSINKVVLNTSNEVVEETIATGEQWQNLMAKTLRKGTALFGKQQDLMLTGLEELKSQYSYGNKRFRKLFSLQPADVKKTKKVVKKATAKVQKSIDEVMEAAVKLEKSAQRTAKTVAKKTTAKKTTVAKAAKTVKKAATSKAKATVAKVVAPKKTVTKKTAVKKTVAKKAATTATINLAKLTLVEGIGPKIQELLNNAGIKNLNDLAAAKPADLKATLVAAGTRYQMHDASTWPAQAKLAAAGKLDELKVLQQELKGGK